jgi:hypothetical protein
MTVTKSTTEPHSARARRATWRVVSIAAIALVGAGVACTTKPDAKAAVPELAVDSATPEPVAPEPVAPEPVPVVATPVAAMRRSCDDYTIREEGIGAMEVGDAHDAFRNSCIVSSDSTATDANDGSVRGTVVVSVNGSLVNVQVTENRIYRLSVSDPAFRTVDGLGPGVPIIRLLDWPGAVVLEGDHDLSVVVSAHCGLYFRIAKPAMAPASLGRWTDIVRAMPESTPVERVVVHGCQNRSGL